MTEEEKKEIEANKGADEGFKEVLTRRKSPKVPIPLQPPVKIVTPENKNKFDVLQEKEMEMEREHSEEEPAELSKREKGHDTIQINVELGKEGESMGMPKDQSQMEKDPQKDKGNEEEQVMRILIHEWRHLDERFILEEQKQLYKDMFQKYEKVGVATANHPEQLGAQGS